MALLLGALSGCAGEPRDLVLATGPSRQPGTGGTGGPGASASSPVVGAWEAVLLLEASGDAQTWTTVWRFARDGSCRFTRTTLSLLEGVPRVEDRRCTWRLSGPEILVTWTAGGARALPYQFAGLSPNRLVLEGIEYRRIG